MLTLNRTKERKKAKQNIRMPEQACVCVRMSLMRVCVRTGLGDLKQTFNIKKRK